MTHAKVKTFKNVDGVRGKQHKSKSTEDIPDKQSEVSACETTMKS